MLKIKLFTHTDLDGVGCAVIGKTVFNNIDIEYCDYHNIDEKVDKFIITDKFHNYDRVYITDISVNEDTAELINIVNNTKNQFRLLDHHETALWLNKYSWASVTNYFDKSKTIKTCGTFMFVNVLKEIIIFPFSKYWSILMEFADIVRKYDTWEWKKIDDIVPKQWNDLLYILGEDIFIEDTITKIKNYDLNFTDTDLLLLKLEQNKIDKYVNEKNKSILKMNLLDSPVGIVFGEQYHSELGNKLCEMNPDLDFVVIINMDKSVSYRTIKNNIHLGNDIAKVFGGGGHAKAAGNPISENIKNEVIATIFR